MPMTHKPTTFLLGAACAAALVGFAAPALAQATSVQELTITGRWRAGEDVRSLSAAVPYNDLDLNTAAGRDMLKQRVSDTSRNLCERLGENATGDPLVSCQQDAMNSAREAIRVAIAGSHMPNYAYLADEAYVAPTGAVAATTYGAQASTAAPAATLTTQTVTNGPVPDTRENRRRFGGPMSNAGRMTAPAGN
jgi:UrcA family protein